MVVKSIFKLFVWEACDSYTTNGCVRDCSLNFKSSCFGRSDYELGMCRLFELWGKIPEEAAE